MDLREIALGTSRTSYIISSLCLSRHGVFLPEIPSVSSAVVLQLVWTTGFLLPLYDVGRQHEDCDAQISIKNVTVRDVSEIATETMSYDL